MDSPISLCCCPIPDMERVLGTRLNGMKGEVNEALQIVRFADGTLKAQLRLDTAPYFISHREFQDRYGGSHN